jgi:hypothetical protein
MTGKDALGWRRSSTRVLEYVLRQRRNFNCFHIGSRSGLVVIQGAFVWILFNTYAHGYDTVKDVPHSNCRIVGKELRRRAINSSGWVVNYGREEVIVIDRSLKHTPSPMDAKSSS